MIDLHTHILANVDDGVRTMEESKALAQAAVADGVELIAATPHVRDDYPTGVETMERLVRELRAVLASERVPLELVGGGEIAINRLELLSEEELRRFGLGGNPNYLLLEFPSYGWPLDLPTRIFALRVLGITPVLAHPERNGEVQAVPERLSPLVEQGALVQLTAASLDGRLGSRPRRTAFRLLELGLAHLLASDAHAPETRTAGMSAAAAAVADDRLADWLTRDVPAAIVAGDRLPDRPNRRGRRWLWR